MALIHRAHLKSSLATALALVGAAFTVAVCLGDAVQAQPAGGGKGEHRPPPQEALAACKSLASGAACSFTAPQGNVSGTCFAPQQNLALACRPKDAPMPGRPASGPKS